MEDRHQGAHSAPMALNNFLHLTVDIGQVLSQWSGLLGCHFSRPHRGEIRIGHFIICGRIWLLAAGGASSISAYLFSSTLRIRIMYDCTRNYINGRWVSSAGPANDIINPASAESVGKVSFGASEEIDQAVEAARAAFESFSTWSPQERKELLVEIAETYKTRWDEIAAAITAEMGSPITRSQKAQAGLGIGHVKSTIAAMDQIHFEETMGQSLVVKEPIGVCGLITPWNWPINQIACKVAPAIAAGCTVVLKPSEIAPVSATLWAEVMEAAGVPAGVFNLVHGDGPGAGAALSAHPDVDMMSFTGSTRAGILVAKAAADTVKRVAQELGGKSPNIIMEGAPLEAAVKNGVFECFGNSGQSCNAPSRMLVPESVYEEAVEIARQVGGRARVGDPLDPDTKLGPVVSEIQFDKIQALIQAGIDEGANLLCGGPGRPDDLAPHLEKGYFVRPTIFSNVNNDMTIAREEIFGPVLCMIPYANIDEAVEIANDTLYGLSGYVYGPDQESALAVARRLRTGMVHINGTGGDMMAPFGGYKQSGNGREWGAYGIEDFLETKSLMGTFGEAA
jgi:aldehyde dehydrogenase (NAD+)